MSKSEWIVISYNWIVCHKNKYTIQLEVHYHLHWAIKMLTDLVTQDGLGTMVVGSAASCEIICRVQWPSHLARQNSALTHRLRASDCSEIEGSHSITTNISLFVPLLQIIKKTFEPWKTRARGRSDVRNIRVLARHAPCTFHKQAGFRLCTFISIVEFANKHAVTERSGRSGRRGRESFCSYMVSLELCQKRNNPFLGHMFMNQAALLRGEQA